jgi:hypothetical protein
VERRVVATRSIIDTLSSDQLACVDAIGAALFGGVPLRVGFKGLVSPRPQMERQKKGTEDGQSEGPQRSATGSWSGRQGSPPRPGYSDSSDVVRWAVRADEQFEALRREYPGTKKSSDPNGTWLVVRSFPIGESGPEAVFLIAIPSEVHRVEAWAFWLSGSGTVWIGPRHTNLPHGSACAFPPEDSYHLDCEWPLRRYIDLLSEWSARHLYYAVHDRWPGPQEGRWALYRLQETRLRECCPRCGNLSYYEDCCSKLDEMMLADRSAVAENPPDFSLRKLPSRIYELAKRAGRNPPRIKTFFQ